MPKSILFEQIELTQLRTQIKDRQKIFEVVGTEINESVYSFLNNSVYCSESCAISFSGRSAACLLNMTSICCASVISILYLWQFLCIVADD